MKNDVFLQRFEFNGQNIEFESKPNSVMVNATQMAKIFEKEVAFFMRNEQTKMFLTECLKTENSQFLAIKTEEDLIISKQKSGTWMHRVLALKFAAWLNPAFELWVYMTIEKLLFGEYEELKRSLKESAERKRKIEDLKDRFREEHPEFLDLEQLELEERQAAYRRGKRNRNQLELFKGILDTSSVSNN